MEDSFTFQMGVRTTVNHPHPGSGLIITHWLHPDHYTLAPPWLHPDHHTLAPPWSPHTGSTLITTHWLHPDHYPLAPPWSLHPGSTLITTPWLHPDHHPLAPPWSPHPLAPPWSPHPLAPPWSPHPLAPPLITTSWLHPDHHTLAPPSSLHHCSTLVGLPSLDGHKMEIRKCLDDFWSTPKNVYGYILYKLTKHIFSYTFIYFWKEGAPPPPPPESVTVPHELITGLKRYPSIYIYRWGFSGCIFLNIPYFPGFEKKF